MTQALRDEFGKFFFDSDRRRIQAFTSGAHKPSIELATSMRQWHSRKRTGVTLGDLRPDVWSSTDLGPRPPKRAAR